MKTFVDLSWDATEEEYRNDDSLSYSILSRYDSLGFDGLDKLSERISTPSLTFGSAVDAWITGGEKEFNDRFIVAEMIPVTQSVSDLVYELYKKTGGQFKKMDGIPYEEISSVIEENGWNMHWKPETRVKVLKEKGSMLYSLLGIAKGRTVLDTETYNDVERAVAELQKLDYFREVTPFENVEKHYQLKFRGDIDGIPLRSMMDEVIIDHDKKTIIPVDLKTTKSVATFRHSFYEYHYYIQAKLYTYLLKQALLGTEFEEYEISPYKFIAIDRKRMFPVVFSYSGNMDDSIVIDLDGKVRKDWKTLARELWYYLHNDCKLPLDMSTEYHNKGEIII